MNTRTRALAAACLTALGSHGCALPALAEGAADAAPSGAAAEGVAVAASRSGLPRAGALLAVVLLPIAYLLSRRLFGAARLQPARDRLRAAERHMRSKDYIAAADIFREQGDHLRAARALERFGNRVAAAREYSAAGSHARASRLLEGQMMYAEAAEAYLPLLGAGQVTSISADRHATYATLLALAGDRERAEAVFRRVLAVAPAHPRVPTALRSLRAAEPLPAPAAPPAPEDLAREIEGEAWLEAAARPSRVITLRSMIRAGRLEPRQSMRLWVQAMRALSERHRGNVVLGCVSPDTITVDVRNSVCLEPPAARPAEYLAPEVRAGLAPDRQADIYSMGVVLYELVTGSTAQLGRRRAGEIFPDVPPWLDEMIGRCTENDPTQRFRTTEEVCAALLKLKRAASYSDPESRGSSASRRPSPSML